jgi:hypothetical protein
MRHLIILVVHLITTVLRLVPPGGVRAVVAESVLRQTSTAHPQPFTPVGTQSPCLRSDNRRILFALDSAELALANHQRRSKEEWLLRRSEYSQLVRMKSSL